MRHFTFYSSLLIAVCCFTGCLKTTKRTPPVPALPEATQTGANTFGCYINDTLYLPSYGNMCFALQVDYYTKDSVLHILSTDCKGEKGVALYIFGLSKTNDSYAVNGGISAFRYDGIIVNQCSILDNRNSTQEGTIQITRFDLSNKIVSGTFSGNIKAPGCRTVNLKSGVFDVKMNVY